MKILSVVGARPEFIQAMPISQTLRAKHQEILVHTGQHYDYKMSQTFFDELRIPVPDHNLEAGSASQAEQTAEIMIGLEKVLVKEKPDFVIIRGDTNSSLAGALATSKLNIPFAHVEAGERSFNRGMPEEINRIVVDHLADFHFCVSQAGKHNLSIEGITERVYWVGDVMLEAMLQARPLARAKSSILKDLELESKHYALVTIHRPSNTDSPKSLEQIISALNQIAETIILPAHPRTQKALSKTKTRLGNNIRLIQPVGYFDMLVLEENARLIATDSGGVQREAYYLGIPCLTLRDETEWGATVETGWNILVGADQKKILENWFGFLPPEERPAIYGNGNTSQQIADIIDVFFESKSGDRAPGRQSTLSERRRKQ